ncbi:hypothetical protein GCM10009718_33240 [Isoptericola halotolerans]|uniref:Phage Mu protein F like protein n=1 Tax=Isoptericola halotolerans TaxID=300560 RepID=A0ABX2A5T6_9MICO|nr:hypothetical protein [Isoptericola halotolerans]NOV98212.1 hypothetical protein [Isoptericola halotolerans]
MVRVDTHYPLLRARRERDATAALVPVVDAITDDLAARLSTGARITVPAALRRDLRDVIHAELTTTADEAGQRVALALGDERARKWDPEVMQPWLRKTAASIADGETEYWARLVRYFAENPDEATDAAMDALVVRISKQAPALAGDMVTASISFAAQDAGEANDAEFKVWRVNSTNPRESHAALSGETVPMRESFSNGLRQPGARGPAEETANCRCSIDIVKGDS